MVEMRNVMSHNLTYVYYKKNFYDCFDCREYCVCAGLGSQGFRFYGFIVERKWIILADPKTKLGRCFKKIITFTIPFVITNKKIR